MVGLEEEVVAAGVEVAAEPQAKPLVVATVKP